MAGERGRDNDDIGLYYMTNLYSNLRSFRTIFKLNRDIQSAEGNEGETTKATAIALIQ